MPRPLIRPLRQPLDRNWQLARSPAGACARPEELEAQPLQWHTAPIRSLAFSADGNWLATGDASGTVRLWPWRQLAAC